MHNVFFFKIIVIYLLFYINLNIEGTNNEAISKAEKN